MYDKMDYGTFQQEIQEMVKEELKDKGDYDLLLYTSHKNNMTKTGLMISEKGKTAAPTIYLNEFYAEYLKGMPLSGISSQIASFAREHVFPDELTELPPDYGKAKEKLRVRLAGRERNQAYLEEGLYRPHTMGAEVVYVELADLPEGKLSVRVTPALAEQWGVPEQEVFETALANSLEKDAFQFVSLAAETNRLLGLESPEEESVKKNELYIVTNPERTYGAAVVLYPGVMEEIHRKMGGDFYILPSSVHEVLVMTKDSDFTPEELSRMVREVNQNEVNPEEWLGNSVYEFLGETGTLQKCKAAEKERER